MKNYYAPAWTLPFLLCAVAAPAQTTQAPAVESASEDVPAAAAAQARSAAERSPRFAERGGRTVFIGVDLIRIKEGAGRDRTLYRVRHYRYADDTTITSLVDARSGAMTEQAETPHAAVPLSVEEFEEARTLALANERVAASVAPFRGRLTVGPLVVRTSDPRDPWFGRRIVRLLFRVGADYLGSPIVYVDLSRRQVILEPGHGPAHGEPR